MADQRSSNVVDLTYNSDTSDSEDELPPVETWIKSPHRPKPLPEQTVTGNSRHLAHTFLSHTANASPNITIGDTSSNTPKRPKKGTFPSVSTSTKTLKHKSSLDSSGLRATGSNETQAEKRRRLHSSNERRRDTLNAGSNDRTERGHKQSSNLIERELNISRGPLPYGGSNGITITSTAELGARGLEFVAPVGMEEVTKPSILQGTTVLTTDFVTRDDEVPIQDIGNFRPRQVLETSPKIEGLDRESVAPRPPPNIGLQRLKRTLPDDHVRSQRRVSALLTDLSTNESKSHKAKESGSSKEPETFVASSTQSTPRVSSPEGPGSLPADRKNLGNRWTEEEDSKIMHLRKDQQLSWLEIGKYFPERTPGAIQTRFSNIKSKKPWTKRNLVLPRDSEDGPSSVLATQKDIDCIPETPTDSTSIPSSEDSVLGGAPSYTPIDLQSLENSVFAGSRSPQTEPSVMENSNGRSRARPRRVVQDVDYAAQQRLRPLRASEQLASIHTTPSVSPSRLTRAVSDSVEVESQISPIQIIELPNQDWYDKENAIITTDISGQREGGKTTKYPYLRNAERQSTHQGFYNGDWDPRSSGYWPGTVIHVDFQIDEMRVIEKAIIRVLGLAAPRSRSVRKRIHKMLANVPESRLYQISWEARHSRKLQSRSRESVEAFLMDAAAGLLTPFPRIERVGNILPKRVRSSMSSLLRQREFGSDSRKRWTTHHNPGFNDIREHMFDTFGAAYSYTGMSNDVLSVSWHPDGQRFAAGAACVVDADSMQYNRPNNLLFGDTMDKTLREFPDHHIMRELAESGVNSRHSMHVSQDPRLFTTISMVEFSHDGYYMFSAGYDESVRVYTSYSNDREMTLAYTLKHKAPVDLLATNKEGYLATACQRDKKPIKLIHINAEPSIKPKVRNSFHSRKATERADLRILPRALKFDPGNGNFLLAGFGANTKDDGFDTVGEICLWDMVTEQELNIHGSNRNVFDLAFNPHRGEGGIFAVGCVAGSNVNRGAHSVVRFYDFRTKYSMFMELECTARDMNDVLYCPYDDVYFAAGCTDGKTYVWDIRRPDAWIYKLSHGESLTPLDRQQPAELQDTGIRFCSWGDTSRRLYTGSSDGVVKSWDITHAKEDVFINDLVTLNSGVMSAAFSPDKTSLLIGEVNGSINVLELGREDRSVKDVEHFRFIPAQDELRYGTPTTASQKSESDSDSGVAIATDLVHTRQIDIVPLGGLPIRQAVQGPAYSGPYDAAEDAAELRKQSHVFQQNMLKSSDGPQCEISACVDSIVKLTLEEAGDSGRSKDRIPDSLRTAWTLSGGSESTVVAGKSKCSYCSRPARPSSGGEDEALCERCSFDCFDCGNRAVVADDTNLVWCLQCNRRWDIGVLGYEPVRRRGGKEQSIGKDSLNSAATGNEDATLGDELNDLADYYHSLWIDRPPSPL